MRRQVDIAWLYQILKKAEGEIESQLNSHLERGPAPSPAPLMAAPAAPPFEAPESSKRIHGGTSSLATTNPSPRTRAPRHPSLTSKRYIWKAEEETTLKWLLDAASSKNKEINWTSVSRKLRIPIDKCKRKAKSLGNGNKTQRIESEEEEQMQHALSTSAPSHHQPPHSAPIHHQPHSAPSHHQPFHLAPEAAPAAAVRLQQTENRMRLHVEDTPLRTQVHRILQAAGGEGTVDEVLEELLIEPRWMREEGGRAGLRKRVAAVLSSGSGSGLGLFESTTQLRGASHRRVVYRQIG